MPYKTLITKLKEFDQKFHFIKNKNENLLYIGY